MIAGLLLALAGLPGARRAQEARLDPPRARPRPATPYLELRAALRWVERGYRPWSGRTPLCGPGWRQPDFDGPEPPPDLPPG